MVVTWLHFGEILVETVILQIFSLKNFDMFFQGQILFWPYLRNGWSQEMIDIYIEL